ncbi:MAG: DNA repair protein RecO [Bacteroidetes bacterium]|nr:DNA repair protein RecO [Bacteroidota bacterium]
MLQTTRGIVLRTVKYSESSIIAKIYTEAFGIQSYMVRGFRSKKSNLKQALFQPLNLLDIVAYHRENKEIQNLKEIKIAYPFTTIPFDIRKSTQLLFINEVLYQVMREEEPNPALFSFLFESIIHLDTMKKNIAFFHQVFLIQLTQYLGFFPRNNHTDKTPNFELTEGIFSAMEGPESLVTQEPYGRYLALLIQTSVIDSQQLDIDPRNRHKLLEIILTFYRHHIPGLKEFKSHRILQQVLAP